MSNSIARILVTGAAGFIGSHTIDCLLQTGRRVIGIDDLSTGRLSNLSSALSHHAFSFIRGDITDPNRLMDLCGEHEPDAIVHLAGLVSVTKAQASPELNYRLNVHATHLVAEAARHHGIGRVVFASTAAVYGNNEELPLNENADTCPVGMYGAAKLASEKILLGYGASYGLSAVCLRYFNAYGPRQDPQSPYSGVISIFGDRFAEGRPVTVYGDGRQTRDFISVRDIARANVIAVTTPGLGSMSCNICTGIDRSIGDLLDVFRDLYPQAPYAEFVPARAGEIDHSIGDPERAAEILKFRSRIGLEIGLRDLSEYNARPKASA